MTVAPLTTTVMADAHRGDSGIASGVNNAVARLAGLVGIATVGVAVASRSGAELDLAGFQLGMAVTAALVAGGGIVGLLGIRTALALGRSRWYLRGDEAPHSHLGHPLPRPAVVAGVACCVLEFL